MLKKERRSLSWPVMVACYISTYICTIVYNDVDVLIKLYMDGDMEEACNFLWLLHFFHEREKREAVLPSVSFEEHFVLVRKGIYSHIPILTHVDRNACNWKLYTHDITLWWVICLLCIARPDHQTRERYNMHNPFILYVCPFKKPFLIYV